MLNSTDQGTNWFVNSTFTNNTINTVNFINEYTGWVGGLNGNNIQILRLSITG